MRSHPFSRRGVLAAAGATLALTACGSGGGDAGGGSGEGSGGGQADSGGTLRWATNYFTSGFDPHKTKQGSDVIGLYHVYDRLVHRDKDGNAIPGLAESWEIAPDLKTVTFKLRKGLRFPSDGSPCNAAAVKANLDRARQKDSITATLLTPIASIDTPDDTTVVLHTSTPPVALVLTMADLPGMILNPASFSSPERVKGLATKPDGIGRWQLTKLQPNARYEFTATPDYWDPQAIKAKNFTIDVMADPQTRLNAVQGGQLDIAIGAPSMYGPARAAGLKVVTVVNRNLYAMYFNQKRSQFARKEVRQAILHAIDRRPMVEVALEGEGLVADQFFPEDSLFHSKEAAGLYPHDPEKAKDLLARAGAQNVAFTLFILNFPEHTKMAEIMKDQLSKVGIDMTIAPKAAADLSPQFNGGAGDAVLTTWVSRTDPSTLYSSYFSAASSQNPSKVAPPGFDEALAKADSTIDPKQRGAAMAKVAEIVMKEAAAVPLAFYKHGSVVNDKVVGYEAWPTTDELRGVGVRK